MQLKLKKSPFTERRFFSYLVSITFFTKAPFIIMRICAMVLQYIYRKHKK